MSEIPDDVARYLEEHPSTILVKDGEVESLLLNYNKTIQESEKLCENIDPEDTPYKSKYKARDLLVSICRNMEASRAIAMVEGTSKVTIKDLDWRIAAIRVKLATIGWDTEEPHTTESELELASSYYYPELYKAIMLVEELEEYKEPTALDKQKLGKQLDNIEAEVPPLPLKLGQFDYSLIRSTLPSVEIDKDLFTVLVDAMHGLNLSGILWAGRGRVRRSFMFLYSCYNLYHSCFPTIPDAPTNTVPASVVREIESTHTHTLFYLAQAFGHLQNMKKSSLYCHQTLQRQLLSNFDDNRLVYDWVKNALGMADYYLNMESYLDALYTILSAEKVFNDYILSPVSAASPESEDSSSVSELHGEVLKKLIGYYLTVMRVAFEREVERREEETVWTKSKLSDKPLLTAAPTPENSPVADSTYEHFRTLPVRTPSHALPSQVTNFADARVLFLRTIQYIESAKKMYPLDGM